MSNTLLNSDVILRKALMVLHQKSNFIGTINRQYDDQFAKDGGKIGTTLRIRKPNRYTVTTGAVMDVQDTTETSTTLTVATQKHVAMKFSAADLTMKIDDFSDRYIEPAMAQLAANIEADAMSMYKDVYQQAGTINSALTMAMLLGGRKKLTDALAPNSKRIANLCTQHTVDLVDALKGLFHESTAIEEQYREGKMGRTGGFDFYENSLWTQHTSGSDDGNDHTVNGANQTGATVTVATGTGTFLKGDIVTFAGCNRVHPESKADTGSLMQFVVTANYAGGAGNLAISPSIVTSGATQNVAASPTSGGTVTKIGGVSEPYDLSMLYHPDAFTIVTADLEVPRGVHFASRQRYDGVSMRIVSDYNITNDEIPTRIDILYGYLAVRPELACRLVAN